MERRIYLGLVQPNPKGNNEFTNSIWPSLILLLEGSPKFCGRLKNPKPYQRAWCWGNNYCRRPSSTVANGDVLEAIEEEKVSRTFVQMLNSAITACTFECYDFKLKCC